MKKKQTVNEDPALMAASNKVTDLQAKEKELLAQIEKTAQEPSGTPRPLLIQIDGIRAALQTARQEAHQAQHRAAERLCKEIQPEARKHAKRTAAAVRELAEAVKIEGAFYEDLQRRGLSRRYRPAQWRLDRRIHFILADFAKWQV